ncbi:TPR Domain containing protein [Chitinispirillum alkaliphilum]|nr:TPR Domain containing protein [Chitinispirillum alkaliphilum]
MSSDNNTTVSLREQYQKNPEDFNIAQKYARNCTDNGWYNEALDIYNKFIGSRENDFSLLLEYGNLLCKMGEEKKAQTCFQKIIALKPERIEGYNNLGILKLKSGEIEEAGEAFGKVVELEPGNVGALLNLGNYHSQKGELREAADLFRRAVDLCPDFPDAWYNLGNVYLSMEDYDGAVKSYQKALSYRRDFSSALKNMGYAYEKSEDFDNALKCYCKALEFNKADWGIQVNLGNIHLRNERLEDAKRCFLKAVRLAPKETSGWLGLRHIALMSGDITTYIRSTLAIFSRLSTEVIASSIEILKNLGHHNEAEDLLVQADKLNRNGDELDALRLVFYQRKGSNQGRIIAIYKNLTSLRNPKPLILSCLVEYAFMVGSYERVVRFFNRIKEPSSDSQVIYWKSLVKLGEKEKAQRLAGEYSKRYPEAFEGWMFLAEMKASEGDENESEKLLIRALSAGFTDLDCIKRNPVLSKIIRTMENSTVPVSTN